MEPSLLLGEHMFCVMNVWQDQPIRRGDIVLFQKGGAFWVKRVIGLPGDSVELIDGFVSLNGRRLDRAEIGPWPGASHSSPGGQRRGVLYRETLPDGRNYEIGRSEADRRYFDNVPAATVPADSLFVLGDNRDNSLDSRMTELGFVPISQVIRFPSD
jgi:signal peptidase I